MFAKLEAWPLDNSSQSMQIGPFQEKTVIWAPLFALHSEPWGDTLSESLCAHQELFLCLLWSCEFPGTKSYWLSLLCVLGTCLSGAVLNIRALDVGLKSFTLQGEAGSWKFPPDCMLLCRDRVYYASVFQPLPPFWCGYFLFHWMCKSLSAVTGFLSEEITLYVAVDLVCLGGSKFMSHLCCHLGPEVWKFTKIKEKDFVRSCKGNENGNITFQ